MDDRSAYHAYQKEEDMRFDMLKQRVASLEQRIAELEKWRREG